MLNKKLRNASLAQIDHQKDTRGIFEKVTSFFYFLLIWPFCWLFYHLF
jgi:hypothetical protein